MVGHPSLGKQAIHNPSAGFVTQTARAESGRCLTDVRHFYIKSPNLLQCQQTPAKQATKYLFIRQGLPNGRRRERVGRQTLPGRRGEDGGVGPALGGAFRGAVSARGREGGVTRFSGAAEMRRVFTFVC